MVGAARPGMLIPATALVALVFFDTLRVWLPSLLFVVGDAGSTPATAMGAVAIVVAAVPALVCAALGAGSVRLGWPLGIALLVTGRIGLQAVDGGSLQFVTSSVAVIGAGIALGAIGAGAVSGHHARAGVLLGVVGSIVIHAGLGTTDLAWRSGPSAWAALALILGAVVIAARRAFAILDPAVTREVGPAWPWWLFGPIFVLLGVLTAAPGRMATATGWDDALVAAMVVLAHGLAIIALVVGRWFGPVVAGTAGAGLVLFGTAGSLRADSVIAVLAQILLATGLGFVIAATDRTDTASGPRTRAIAAAAIPLSVVLVGFAYYAGFDLALPFRNRVVLLVASLIVAAAGLVAATTGSRPALRQRGLLRRALGTGVATLMAATLAAGLVAGPAPIDPEPGSPETPMRVALFNIHMGFDPDGRLSIEEIGDLLAAESPDIVILNEIDRGWLTTGNQDTLRLLQSRLGLPYAFGPAADEIWGNAVLSRFPVTERSVERLPRGRDAMGRSQLITILEVAPERRIALVTTHLSHVDSQGDTRLPQARAVAGTVARLQERAVPVIVAGDLNAEPEDAELATFGELARSAVPPGTPTWPAWDPEVQIDHILVTREFEVLAHSVPQVEASDHLPIFVTLTLNAPVDD